MKTCLNLLGCLRELFAILVLFLSFGQTASAAILYESSTPGATGVPYSDLVLGNVPGTNITPTVFTGVRFQLSEPVLTSQVGGHFVAPATGTFFGAIVALDGAEDFPNSNDLTTSDVRGATLLTFPTASAEVFGNISIPLDAGWYALIFDSGLFQAGGTGAGVANGLDIGGPQYIALQPNSGVPWIDISPILEGQRFLLTGTIVPEPESRALALIVSLSLMWAKRS